ncbi:geranylgeranylglyceryl diphosphate synthase [Thermococcus kodakarensis KOD1]|uniref:Geranylgeranylglyceryl phosphate synthase n=1 Tax=Thermococcus kodakarensis (strain ATCC BAA-918 / JCM 12380 / KOD1) TaxID=69014 RepID=GGGPS_THEKO|nr:geranylgeranylglyceryl/heptaprenylglyceryl phosphate synthase [Thermococcus kodakarensis]Q5JDY1.1 RecName: Full=Geranylgeranylglyceryl phosphate synthase; Short=GGGP synthase; Short=GGGPS; AltName: Full=(S)-3-O-geranylgeranylglyceryl phosphate synthase; AltName: Full=Phosphoglycerol geranylgeranyltransferase [Thermococcus kodakarensis KOD1]WCN28991.1 geranylgeranylglyceryl/heptaprenylglyceryl phosphate synthase [Thermococcus kodakarensis]WCN31297.1 geranylgeranylglyceryl/heptaprenylglyceryl p
MLKLGKVETYIHEKLEREKLHFVLLDPDDVSPELAGELASMSEEVGVDAIMVGGSTGAEGEVLDSVVRAIKESSNLPVILFPGSHGGISKYADAIFFMSLLNSRNPFFITGAQALGAFQVKRYGIEPIPMAYLIIEPGETVGWVGDAKPIPRHKPKIAAAYALAGQYLGMRLVYLEAGSGAPQPVPPEMIGLVKRVIDVPLIVGGGIRTEEQARAAVKAGADIIVTGTAIEKAGSVEKAREKLEELNRGVKG